MATKKRNTPQFDIDKILRDRPLERAFFRHGTLAAIAKAVGYAGLTAMIWPRFIAPRRWKLTYFDVAMPHLGREFDGYKIAQLSDLHTGSAGQSHLRRVIEHIQGLKPDLIVITGDLIEYRAGSVEKLAELLPLLHAPDGVAAIYGNHDYHEYSWRHVGPRSAHRAIHKRLGKLLERFHIDVLRNERRVIRREKSALYIVGMDELWTGNADAKTAFGGIPEDAACICLQHNPDGFEMLHPYPWQLLLCGHTHGGQVRLPVVGSLFVPMKHRRYIRGWYSMPAGCGGVERRMFVSSGLGQSLPVRLGVPPEASIFTLRRGPVGIK